MPTQPWLMIIGGPNGAGKTTFARAAAPRWALRYLAADLVAEDLGLGKAGPDAFHAGRLFIEGVRSAISRRESLIVESTLSGLYTRHLIRRAKTSGYRVSVGFVYVDSAEAASGGSVLGSRRAGIWCPTTTCGVVSGAAL